MTARVPVRERDFQKQVIDLARTCGFKVWHFHDSRRQIRPGKFVGDQDAKGWPDLVLVHPGRGITIFAELKVPPNKPTDAQYEALNVLRSAGHNAVVWTPGDWPNISDTLTRRTKT